MILATGTYCWFYCPDCWTFYRMLQLPHSWSGLGKQVFPSIGLASPVCWFPRPSQLPMMTELERSLILSHSLAAYATKLPQDHRERFYTRVINDTHHWTTSLFRSVSYCTSPACLTVSLLSLTCGLVLELWLCWYKLLRSNFKSVTYI